jgi:hypothetical protein
LLLQPKEDPDHSISVNDEQESKSEGPNAYPSWPGCNAGRKRENHKERQMSLGERLNDLAMKSATTIIRRGNDYRTGFPKASI